MEPKSFYHVWESMIDWVYGADNKERYYPKTKWRIGKKLYYKYPAGTGFHYAGGRRYLYS